MLATIPCIWNSRREELTVSTTVAAVAAAIALGTVVATTAVEATAAAAVGAFRGLVNTDDAAVESDLVNILLHTMADRIGEAKKKKKKERKKGKKRKLTPGCSWRSWQRRHLARWRSERNRNRGCG